MDQRQKRWISVKNCVFRFTRIILYLVRDEFYEYRRTIWDLISVLNIRMKGSGTLLESRVTEKRKWWSDFMFRKGSKVIFLTYYICMNLIRRRGEMKDLRKFRNELKWKIHFCKIGRGGLSLKGTVYKNSHEQQYITYWTY